jgi:hypothetical protein
MEHHPLPEEVRALLPALDVDVGDVEHAARMLAASRMGGSTDSGCALLATQVAKGRAC